MRPIVYRLARLLQIIGMIVLPVAVAGNLIPENDPNHLNLKWSLTLSSIGVGVFVLGWLLQQSVGPRQ